VIIPKNTERNTPFYVEKKRFYVNFGGNVADYKSLLFLVLSHKVTVLLMIKVNLLGAVFGYPGRINLELKIRANVIFFIKPIHYNNISQYRQLNLLF